MQHYMLENYMDDVFRKVSLIRATEGRPLTNISRRKGKSTINYTQRWIDFYLINNSTVIDTDIKINNRVLYATYLLNFNASLSNHFILCLFDEHSDNCFDNI